MNYQKLTAIATSMIAFSGFLGGLIAMVYYFFLTRELNILNAIVGGIIYIDTEQKTNYIL